MRCADQSAVSSFSVGSNPQPPAPATSSNRVSKLLFMAKHYSGAPEADWEDAFAAPMAATVCGALGGLRLDQALARTFPQYSRNRLQAWLKSGHIRVNGSLAESTRLVVGGERIDLVPPLMPQSAAPRAPRIPLRIVFQGRHLI